MNGPVKTPRRYDSTNRTRKAEANRIAILESAERLFVAGGYPGTSIAAIAADAGVSEDLVYRHFPTKRQLVVEVLNYVVTGESAGPAVLDQQGPQAVRAETDQRRQIAMFAADIAGRTERGRPIDDVLLSAAVVDEEIALKHRSMHRTRLRNLTQFVSWVAANGPLRQGLSIDEAAASVWAMTGAPMHRQLVDELGWTQEEFAGWIEQSLIALLLPPDSSTT